MTFSYTEMRNEIDALIDEFGRPCRVRRLSGTVTTTGRVSGSFVSAGTVQGWIQPYELVSRQVSSADPGIVAETTHLMTVSKSAMTIEPRKDKILPIDETFQYDVLAEMTLDTHKEIRLKRLPRT